MSERKTFWRSIGVVLSGAAVGQLIPILGSLMLARLFAPAAFGTFASWLGIVTILSVVVTGRFEVMLAIAPDGTPRRAALAATLATLLLGAGLAEVLLLAVLAGELLPDQAWLAVGVPVVAAAAVLAAGQTFQAFVAAEGNYRQLNILRVVQAIGITGAQIGAGLVAPTADGMALAYFIGCTASLVLALIFSHRLLVEHFPRRRDLVDFWSRYRRFPALSLPADTLNAAAAQLPVILVSLKFGADVAGYLALSFRTLGAPISLLANAVLDVFKRRAAAAWRERGDCRHEYVDTFRILGVGAVLFVVVVGVGSEWLFVTAFGERWRSAGTIAAWLLPLFGLRFVASPLSYVLYIANKQHVDLVWQAGLLAMVIGSFALFDDYEMALRTYGVGYALFYVVYLWISYRASSGGKTG